MRFCEVVGGSGGGAHISLILFCSWCSLCSGVQVYVSLMLVLLEVFDSVEVFLCSGVCQSHVV